MTLNTIYQQIEIDTQACIESKLKGLGKLRTRRHYEGDCRVAATAKYNGQIETENIESEAVSDSVQAKLLSADTSIALTLIIGLAIILLVYFFLK